jgi:geranylgeranyl diphosphate synthase type I
MLTVAPHVPARVSVMVLGPSLEDLRREIDGHLGTFLDTRAAKTNEARPLIDEIRRVIALGGKRLRPSFCYWGYRAAGADHGGEIVRAAASLELLHTFALVHDDIMDASDTRRGRPSTYAQHGLSFALLVGDLALVLADESFMTSGFPPQIMMAAFAAYSRMRQEVIAGQYLDLKTAGDRDVPERTAREIASLKSGRYSVEEPIVIGALLAGAPASLVDELHAFGRPLGEAFQVRDDVLGLFGDPIETGKPVDSDIRQGKRNVLYARTIQALSGPDRDYLRSRWGAADLSEEEVAHLRSLVETSGARAECEDLVEELRGAAATALEAIDISGEGHAALTRLISLAVDRES